MALKLLVIEKRIKLHLAPRRDLAGGHPFYFARALFFGARGADQDLVEGTQLHGAIQKSPDPGHLHAAKSALGFEVPAGVVGKPGELAKALDLEPGLTVGMELSDDLPRELLRGLVLRFFTIGNAQMDRGRNEGILQSK